MYGRATSLPPCTAKVNIRLSAISSRLISALDAPAAWRLTTNALTRAVLIAVKRRPPKKGFRCLRRCVIVTRDRRALVR